jgi:hypothetical protein
VVIILQLFALPLLSALALAGMLRAECVIGNLGACDKELTAACAVLQAHEVSPYKICMETHREIII